MAKLKMEAIFEKKDYELRRALEDALQEVLPGVRVDVHELYRAFTRAVARKCSTWETVPDRYVKKTSSDD
jgi:hypothetical protein